MKTILVSLLLMSASAFACQTNADCGPHGFCDLHYNGIGGSCNPNPGPQASITDIFAGLPAPEMTHRRSDSSR